MKEPKETAAAKEAPERPQEAVQELKATREARGLSLNDLFAMTRVSLINLQAVENGDYDRLPPPVYARNFIRKYAQAVGVDEKPLLILYERHLEGMKPPREETEVRKPWPENGRRYRFLYVSLAAVISAGILVYAVFLYNQSDKPLPPALAVEPVSVLAVKPDPPVEPLSTAPANAPPAMLSPVPASPATTTAASTAPAAAPLPAAAPGKLLHLVIETRELTWIRITEDKNPPYQALLKPGDTIERMASDYFLLDIGNAGGVNLIFQGKNLGSLGKRGQIIHMRLPEKTPERKTP